jgi:proline dehydrogenase
MVASHNEDTIRFTLKMLAEFDLDPSGKTICFGQLYGMCDHVSLPLGQGGFKIYKYVPYGPILEVMPYMSRRVTENGNTMLQRTHKERKLLLKELFRRFVTFTWWYTPKRSMG